MSPRETGNAEPTAAALVSGRLKLPAPGMAGPADACRAFEVRTPDGVRLAAQEWSRPAGGQDILFIHGFSQSHLCWRWQVTSSLVESFRLVTYDNRGHGFSDKPPRPEAYRSPDRWADEVRAVIEQAGLTKPILVAWSYAGRIALDYLARHGDGAIAGLVMVGATSSTDVARVGPAAALLKDMGDEDPERAEAAAGAFIARCTFRPLPPEEADHMRASTALTPPDVRRALSGRPADYDAVLRALRVPLLAVQGREDAVILPAMAEHTAKQAGGRCIVYPGVGHMPFWEIPDRFNADLGDFARVCAGTDGHAPGHPTGAFCRTRNE